MAVIEPVSLFGRGCPECERKCQAPLEIRARHHPSAALHFHSASCQFLFSFLFAARYANLAFVLPLNFFLLTSQTLPTAPPPPNRPPDPLLFLALCCLIKPLVCPFFYLQPDISVFPETEVQHVRRRVNQLCGIKQTTPDAQDRNPISVCFKNILTSTEYSFSHVVSLTARLYALLLCNIGKYIRLLNNVFVLYTTSSHGVCIETAVMRLLTGR